MGHDQDRDTEGEVIELKIWIMGRVVYWPYYPFQDLKSTKYRPFDHLLCSGKVCISRKSRE